MKLINTLKYLTARLFNFSRNIALNLEMTLLLSHSRYSYSPIAAILIIVMISLSCNGPSAQKRDAAYYAAGTKEGYELAKYHCGNCHAFVPANVLDRDTWKNSVLPDMASQLGIEVMFGTEYVNSQTSGADLTFKDWKKIVDYYIKSAPEKIQQAVPPVAIIPDSSYFSVKTPASKSEPFAKTVLTVIDTATNSIFTSDAQTNYLYRWNTKLQLIDSVQTYSPAVSAVFYNDAKGKKQGAFTTIGGLLATDAAIGKILQFDLANKLGPQENIIAKNLPRPVCLARADINNDSLADWVVCGFGHTKGGLYWFEQLPGGEYKKRNILERAGATQVVVEDFNNDGWNDIIALFAHEDECIRLFINKHNGAFTETKLLSFPPVNGSTSFQLVDFNNDGLKDILYTCGDNADVSKIFKPFHGVYIYLNKGNSKYEQAYFYPINGCTKAVAADFDMDGKTDIATIAFYADFMNRPREKFLFLRQDGPLHFQPYAPPVENNGRWLCMDVKDYDKDGDPDILLGNFARDFFIEKDYQAHWDVHAPITLLENKKIQK